MQFAKVGFDITYRCEGGEGKINGIDEVRMKPFEMINIIKIIYRYIIMIIVYL